MLARYMYPTVMPMVLSVSLSIYTSKAHKGPSQLHYRLEGLAKICKSDRRQIDSSIRDPSSHALRRTASHLLFAPRID